MVTNARTGHLTNHMIISTTMAWMTTSFIQMEASMQPSKVTVWLHRKNCTQKYTGWSFTATCTSWWAHKQWKFAQNHSKSKAKTITSCAVQNMIQNMSRTSGNSGEKQTGDRWWSKGHKVSIQRTQSVRSDLEQKMSNRSKDLQVVNK